MQGHLIIGAFTLAALNAPCLAAEASKRVTCSKTEQSQQRQQQAKDQQQRSKPQGCTIQRHIPPVVDPTPMFLL